MNTLDELKDLMRADFDFEPASVHADTTFADLGLDSLAMAEFMILIEDKFRIEFPDNQPFVTTVGELVELIDGQRMPAMAEAA